MTLKQAMQQVSSDIARGFGFPDSREAQAVLLTHLRDTRRQAEAKPRRLSQAPWIRVQNSFPMSYHLVEVKNDRVKGTPWKAFRTSPHQIDSPNTWAMHEIASTHLPSEITHWRPL